MHYSLAVLRVQHLLYASVVLLLIAATAVGQVKDAKKFSSVPGSQRQRLIERFNLFVEYERTQQYEKLFDMLAEDFKTIHAISKSRFLQDKRADEDNWDSLIEFTPRAVYQIEDKLDPERYRIVGQARFQRGGKIVQEERILRAYVENGDWYFSSWLVRFYDNIAHPKGNVYVRYDRAHDLRITATAAILIYGVGEPYRLLPYFSGDNVYLFAAYITPGKAASRPQRVALTIWASERHAQYRSKRELSITADDQKFQLGSMEYQQLQPGTYNNIDQLSLPVDTEVFTRIAKSKKVKIKIGTRDFELGEDQLKYLRALAKVMD